MQLLMSGRASAHDAAATRVRRYGPGDAIWPAGPSGEEAPTVTADISCETVVLTPDSRHRLEEEGERLALKLYRYLLARRFGGEPTEDPSGLRIRTSDSASSRWRWPARSASQTSRSCLLMSDMPTPEAGSRDARGRRIRRRPGPIRLLTKRSGFESERDFAARFPPHRPGVSSPERRRYLGFHHQPGEP